MGDPHLWHRWFAAIALAVLLAGGCRGYQPVHPLDNPEVIKLPAGTPPASGPPLGVTASDPSGWNDDDLVLALHEPHIWGGEDSGHARVMVFATGRVLYRVADAGHWYWYQDEIGREAVDALLSETLADLGRTKSFDCSLATDQPTTIVMAKRSKRWLVRSAYALHECLDEVAGPSFGASTTPVGATAPTTSAPAPFLRAYRRLDAVGSQPSAERWRTPRTYLMWHVDHGRYAIGNEEEPAGDPWPDDLPAGPEPAAGPLLMPFDAAYEDRLRAFMGSGALVRYRDERWLVQVIRDHPGDATLACVLYDECEGRSFADPVSDPTL